MKNRLKMALVGVLVINYAAASSEETGLDISPTVSSQSEVKEFADSNEGNVLEPLFGSFTQNERRTEHNNRSNKSLERFLSYFLVFSSN